MDTGSAGNGLEYDTVPQRADKPVMYAEGDDPSEALDFLAGLSDE